ncbi:hypothetical protein [Nocardia africana]|uniref:Tryptophan dimethylallyltransferase n=1 Tax=Nocardia africana TaxID=134964 RepID=A0A378WL28_9NOCA|nr:hypothetical protein [Nocardia africana]MCC3315730.1 hypothetical protein [Nocardia africana]SUA41956.1 Uncharacterised protein [Nocardia africana]
MTVAAATSTGDFVVDVAERIGTGCTPESLRSVLFRACGGRLEARTPDGVRSSGITSSGFPFEASVTGGLGRYSQMLRYITETTTWEPDFAVRLEAYLATITELVTWLPGGDPAAADLLHSFVTTVYPDPVAIEPGARPAMWLGIVHHRAEPDRLGGLKVYCSPRARTDVIETLGRQWSGFEGLSPIPENDDLFRYAGLAIELCAHGDPAYKIYLRARTRNVAVPMKLVRHFGDPAWQTLSEFTACGVDAADLHNFDYFVCCSRRGNETPSYTVSLITRPSDDITALARALAARHHGTTRAIDAMAHAARDRGAAWRYTALGLGFSSEHGIDKLNVYGTPMWESTSEATAVTSARPLGRSEVAR